jgi:hypothetical protein
VLFLQVELSGWHCGAARLGSPALCASSIVSVSACGCARVCLCCNLLLCSIVSRL